MQKKKRFPHCSKKYILHRRHQLGLYESIPRVSPVRVDHRHASPIHGVNKAVDKCHWNRDPYPEKSYTRISCSYKPSSHFSEFYLDFFSQVLYLIQIRTKGRPWHVVLLEHVMLVTANIGNIVRSKNLIHIPLPLPGLVFSKIAGPAL